MKKLSKREKERLESNGFINLYEFSPADQKEIKELIFKAFKKNDNRRVR